MRISHPALLSTLTLFLTLTPGSVAAAPPARAPSTEDVPWTPAARPNGTAVGTIEIVADGGTRTFDVMQGPVTEGFATGWREEVQAGRMVLGASIQGRERGGGAAMRLRLGVTRDSGTQVCDPFLNLVELYPADDRAGRKRLRPGGTSPESCPDLTVDVHVTEATFDEAEGTLHLTGTFSGPLGRGGDAIQVQEGRFEATLHAMDTFMDR